jgi:hypothetical protein
MLDERRLIGRGRCAIGSQMVSIAPFSSWLSCAAMACSPDTESGSCQTFDENSD